MKLYLHYLKMHFKSAMQYKISFVLTFISQFFVFFTFYYLSHINFSNLFELVQNIGSELSVYLESTHDID